MSLLLNNFKIAFRNIKKRKINSIINIGGLALGISSVLIIINFILYETNFDKFHTDSNNIYRVESQFYENGILTDNWATASFGYGSAMKEAFPEIEAFTRIALHKNEQTISSKNLKYRQQNIVYAESSFFSIFSFKLIDGDRKTCLSRPKTIVISESKAKLFFKNENPIGKTLKISSQSEEISCEITGIIEDMPSNSHINYDYIISYNTLPRWVLETWYLHETYTYIKVKPNTNIEYIVSRFPKLSEKYKTRDALRNKTWGIELTAISDIHLKKLKGYERENKGDKNSLLALIIIAIAILSIAWINYINLTTARAVERAKEVGIRKVCGASKYNLIKQFLCESIILNLVAFILAFCIFEMSLGFFNKLMNVQLSYSLMLNYTFIISFGLVFIVGTFLTGLYPAFVLTSINIVSVLKGKYSHSKNSNRIRKFLIILQYSATYIIVFGTFIVYSQLDFMQKEPLGFNSQNTIVLKYPSYSKKINSKLISFKKEIKKLSSIEGISLSGAVPGKEIGKFLSNYPFNNGKKENKLYDMLKVDFDFIELYKIKIITGRNFSPEYGNEINKTIINQSAMKELGFNIKNVIGKKVCIEPITETPLEIIGVVKDWNQQSLKHKFMPIMFILTGQLSWIPAEKISIKINSNKYYKIIDQIKDIWTEFFPQSTFDYFFLDEYFNNQYRNEKIFRILFTIFSLITIFISCLGLWGLIVYACSIRTNEIGIRKVLGASVINILITISFDFMKLVIISLILGIPIAFLVMNNWLDSYAFKISLHWWHAIVPILAILLISFITIIYRIIMTANLNPSHTLKCE